MKILLVILIGLSVMFASASFLIDADARLQNKTVLEHYVENDMILIGQIKDAYNDENNHILYQIEVEKYLKHPQDIKTISVVGPGGKNGTITSIDKIFSIGDRVLLFLNTIDAQNVISPYSVNAENLDVDSDFILPPRILYGAGLSVDDIVCKDDLVLVIKSSNGYPACVTENTASRLKSTGWSR